MIRYALRCAEGHSFESWFQSAEAYERLRESGHVSCVVCGGDRVEKAIMAPNVAASTRQPERPLSDRTSPAEQALAELRRRIESNTEDVGTRFAAEARAIHEGLAPERAIRGQARPAEARALLEDGVPVLPLPWQDSKAN